MRGDRLFKGAIVFADDKPVRRSLAIRDDPLFAQDFRHFVHASGELFAFESIGVFASRPFADLLKQRVDAVRAVFHLQLVKNGVEKDVVSLRKQPLPGVCHSIHCARLRSSRTSAALLDETITFEPSQMLANGVYGEAVLDGQLGSRPAAVLLDRVEYSTAGCLEERHLSHVCSNYTRVTKIINSNLDYLARRNVQ